MGPVGKWINKPLGALLQPFQVILRYLGSPLSIVENRAGIFSNGTDACEVEGY